MSAHLRREVVGGLTIIPGGEAELRELTVGEMRKLRRDYIDSEERGLASIAASMVRPTLTMDDIDAMPVSATAELTRLAEVVLRLSTPSEPSSPPA